MATTSIISFGFVHVDQLIKFFDSNSHKLISLGVPLLGALITLIIARAVLLIGRRKKKN
jgi:hypothetical protein